MKELPGELIDKEFAKYSEKAYWKVGKDKMWLNESDIKDGFREGVKVGMELVAKRIFDG